MVSKETLILIAVLVVLVIAFSIWATESAELIQEAINNEIKDHIGM